MADNTPGHSDEQSLKELFDEAMKMFDNIEKSSEATNSESMQMSIRSAISKFEKATKLVSYSGMFSRNEKLEELPTETLQYMLLPALLGTLSLKLCSQQRKDVITVAEIYFRDFLHRCKDYGVTNKDIPEPTDPEQANRVERCQTEQAKIAAMVSTRDSKIRRYKEMKELKEQLKNLHNLMDSEIVDDETKRQYFTTLLLSYVNQSLEELASIEQEKPLLEYMAQHAGERAAPAPPPRPLRPVVITRDALRRAVLGHGYPAQPALSVEEFYEQRVRDGIFPNPNNIPHRTIETADGDADEEEEIRKEQLVETEDAAELARRREMDEFKDDHRRGWGNRHNRS